MHTVSLSILLCALITKPYEPLLMLDSVMYL